MAICRTVSLSERGAQPAMKVLIISHNPVSSQSNMGKTFLSLFSQFDSSELCQLYIYPTVPNARSCGAFYRVTDKQVLKSLLRLTYPGGEILPEQIREDQAAYEDASDESLYRSRKNKSAARRLLRDAMWGLSRWYSPELKGWLDRENPDCIFVAPGVARFIHNFALRIAGDRKIPIVTYVCDEYYFVREPESPADRFRLGLLRRKIEALMEKTARLVVISEELKVHYEEKFRVKTAKLMTGAAFEAAPEPKLAEHPTAISYFGNIRCNRFLSLGEIGRTLDDINRELGTDYKLRIYTAEKDPEILASLRRFHSVELCGFVSGAEFQEKLQNAELLLHAEAFDEASIDYVQHSVSTKIADSLASGVPFLAYGPACISSMKHLIRHDCAITATAPEMLRDMLLTAFTDGEARRRVAENAIATAREYHDSTATGVELRKILAEVCQQK